MLKTRIITAVVLLVLFGASLIFASADLFALILGFVVAASAWEWSRLSGIRDEAMQTAFAAVVGLASLVAMYFPYNEEWLRWLSLLAFLFWAAVPVLFYLKPTMGSIDTPDVTLLVAGAFLFIVSALAIQNLRSFVPSASTAFLFYVMSIVWLMDIGAYFSGRRFGNNKLAPAISPGKTWEGVYGGLAVVTAVLVVVLIFSPWADGNHFKLFLATLVAAGASVVGDLYESRVKRAADMKDSSQMLPGHGGVLDRIDGVLSAVPVFLFIWLWL